MSKTIHWTAPMLKGFKAAYAQAVANKDEEFIFDGNLFVTGYAKYLIEYLSARLK